MKFNSLGKRLLTMAFAVSLFLEAAPGWSKPKHPVSSLNPSQQLVQVVEIEQALLKAIGRRFGRPKHQLIFHILYPEKAIAVKSGNVRLEPEAIIGGRTGRRAFRLKIFVNDEFIQTLNVTGELKVKVEVAVPTRWIKAKEILTDADLELVSLEVPSLSHDFVLGVEDAVGKQVLRHLPPQGPIRTSVLDSPPLIHKGDRVVIEVRSHGLLVQTVGMAKAAGKPGETIPVQNSTSGREVLGMVMAAGVVEVPF